MLATQSVRTFYDWKEKLFFSPTFLDLVDTLIKIYRQVLTNVCHYGYFT